MAKQFRVNTLILSGREISVDLSEPNTYLSHDGTFKNPNDALDIPSVVGLSTSGDLESTGTALQDQIDSLPSYNLNGLTTSGELESTGTSLQNEIDSLIIPSVVGLSNSGDLESTGTALQDQIDGLSIPSVDGLLASGDADDQYYPLDSNPSGYATGEGVIASRIDGGSILNPNTGEYILISTGIDSNYYLATNPNSFSVSGNVESTGTALQNQIDGLDIPNVEGLTTSGELESTGTSLQNQVDALSIPSVDGLLSSGDHETYSGSLDSYIEETGTWLNTNLVHLAGDETIAGVKTFSSNPKISAIQTPGGDAVLDLTSTVLVDTIGPNDSLDWSARELYDASGPDITLDWDSKILHGDWTHNVEGKIITALNSGSLSEEIEATGTSLQNQVDALSIPSVDGLTTSGELESTGNVLWNQLDVTSGDLLHTITGADFLTSGGKIVLKDNLSSPKITLGYGVGGTTYAGLWRNSSPSTSNYAFLFDGQSAYFNAPTQDIHFRIGNVTKMVVDGGNDNVGIGVFSATITPTSKLDVSGRIVAESMDVSGVINSSGGQVLTVTDSGAIQDQIDNISVTEHVNHNFFFDYPFSGLNSAESYVQEDFIATGIAVGVYTTGHAGPIGINFFQRLPDGTSKISFFNETFSTGIYHQLNALSNLPASGMNRLTVDITGVITGFEGLSVGVLGYR